MAKVVNDLISRADAIDAVAEEWLSEASAESPYVNDDDIGEYRKLAEKLFEDVPSADAVQIPIKLGKRYPESKDEDITDAFMRGYLAGRSSADAVQGEWIECLAYNPDLDADVLYIECAQCGHRPYFSGSYRPKYCEECGARMTKGGDTE